MSISIFGVEGPPSAVFPHSPHGPALSYAEAHPACCPSGIQPITETAPIPYVPERVPEVASLCECAHKSTCADKDQQKKLYLIYYLTIFPSSSNGRLPRILQQRTDRHCSRRGKPCLPIPLPKSAPSCRNLALPGLKGSGAVPEMPARAGKSCSRSPCVSCSPGLPGFSSGRIGGPIFLCSRSASNCS